MHNLLDAQGLPLSQDLRRVLDNPSAGGCGLYVARFYTAVATAFAVGLWFNPALRRPPGYRQTGCYHRIVASCYLADRRELAPLAARLLAAAAPSRCPPPGPGLVDVGCFTEPWPVLCLLPEEHSWRGGPALVQGTAPVSPLRPETPAKQAARRQVAEAESHRALLAAVKPTAQVRVGFPLGPDQPALWLELPAALVRGAAEKLLDERLAQAQAHFLTC